MPAASTVSPVMPRTMASIVVASRRIRLGRGLRRLRSANLFARVALDDFIEFAPIKPNAPTFRTVVNLNALAFAHYQINFACWTKKPMPLALGTCVCDVFHFFLQRFLDEHYVPFPGPSSRDCVPD